MKQTVKRFRLGESVWRGVTDRMETTVRWGNRSLSSLLPSFQLKMNLLMERCFCLGFENIKSWQRIHVMLVHTAALFLGSCVLKLCTFSFLHCACLFNVFLRHSRCLWRQRISRKSSKRETFTRRMRSTYRQNKVWVLWEAFCWMGHKPTTYIRVYVSGGLLCVPKCKKIVFKFVCTERFHCILKQWCHTNPNLNSKHCRQKTKHRMKSCCTFIAFQWLCYYAWHSYYNS